MPEVIDHDKSLESTTVYINRTSTTVKGGRRLGFAALVVVGDRNGQVGVGYGKGRGVPVAIEKAQKDARKHLMKVTRRASTIPHPVMGRFNAASVKLIPAAPGTGVIAGGTVRAVLEMAGINDCLTKAYGSTNKINLCRAVLHGLAGLRSRETVAQLRGVELNSSTVDEMLEASEKSSAQQEAATAKPVKGKKLAKSKTKKKDKPAPDTAEDVATEPERAASAPVGGADGAETAASTAGQQAAESPATDEVVAEVQDAQATPDQGGVSEGVSELGDAVAEASDEVKPEGEAASEGDEQKND
jgi:small subunit ribosomal protein S5